MIQSIHTKLLVTYYDFDNGWWTNGAVVSNTTGFEALLI